MDALRTRSDHSLVKPMALALLLFCFLIVVGCVRILHQHRAAFDELMQVHLQSAFKHVETTLLQDRIVEKDGRLAFDEHSLKMLRAFERHNELSFTGVLDLKKGSFLLSYGELCPEDGVRLPPSALALLAQGREWSGLATCGDRQIYTAAKSFEVPNVSGGAALLPARAALLVGLDATEHRSISDTFQNSVLLNGFHVLGAAVLCGIVILLFLRARQQIRRASALERFQSAILDSTPDGFLILSPEGAIQAANPAAEKIFNKKPGTLIGMNIKDLPGALPLYPPGVDDPDCGPDIANGWTQHSAAGAELEVTTLPVPGPGICVEGQAERLMFIRDRTALKNAEQLAAVGILAAGLAHEIRNPLSAMRGFAQYFRNKFAGSQPDESYALTMMREADRLNRVVGDLLYIAKPQTVSPIEVPLDALLADLHLLLNLELDKAGIAMTDDLAANSVCAGPEALERVLLNLALNSLEALKASDRPEKKLIVRSRPGSASVPRRVPASATDEALLCPLDSGVWIEVEDNGIGMTEEQRLRLFEPFYSGRENGTGLGMLLVRKTMRDHGGKIDIESSPEEGTSVSLFFPRPDAEKGSPTP